MAKMKPGDRDADQVLHQLFASAFDNSRDDAAIGQMYAACLLWRLGLSQAEENRPEAAAVLMGMFDSIAQSNAPDREQAVIRFREVLSIVYERLSYEPVPVGLMQRMLAALDDPQLSPWVLYARRAIQECLTGRDPVDTIAKVIDAVKAGKIG